uniref:TTF-type domain-containing protein n=1 Tax=Sinocyclocheilus rhinocerous TaxID=307959 RepID=A0A673NLW3_9TELE
ACMQMLHRRSKILFYCNSFASDPQVEQAEHHSCGKEDDDPNSWCNTVTDPALWKNTSSDKVKSILIRRGAAPFQNQSSKYPAFTNSLLSCSLPNGQTVSRQWLLYSPSNGCIYCYSCKLFSTKYNAFVDGFCDWKHSERIGEHERSAAHRACMQMLHRRSKSTETIDSDLIKQMDSKREYWKQVLRRVVSVIKFLDNGHFLGILELLAEYDPFLAEHIRKFGWKGKGTVSYLSSTTCEEFIQLMGEKIKQTIAKEIQNAKYFSVIVDSTPDLSHVDQLTFIFRFVDPDGHVVERFLAFEPIESHTGESLADCILAMVDSLRLDLSNCRRQSYDNASNMSGKYKGVQTHLKRSNPFIHFVPCAAHSLNLWKWNGDNGNFLGILELLAEYDPFLAEHIQKFGWKGKGTVSYLSSTTCEEFIQLMGKKIKQTIAKEIQNQLVLFHLCKTLWQRSEMALNVITDKLTSCLQHRLEAYKHLTELFGVLFMPVDFDITASADALSASYPLDLDKSLADELTHFRSFMQDEPKIPLNMLQTMINLNLQSTFPNVHIALKLFLTLPVTNCEGERSFSKMSRVKNELRTRMCQERLNSLSLMSIESELLKELSFDEVVDDFARRKTRKKLL